MGTSSFGMSHWLRFASFNLSGFLIFWMFGLVFNFQFFLTLWPEFVDDLIVGIDQLFNLVFTLQLLSQIHDLLLKFWNDTVLNNTLEAQNFIFTEYIKIYFFEIETFRIMVDLFFKEACKIKSYRVFA